MDLTYSAEQALLRETLERLLRNVYSPEQRKRIVASADGRSPEAWQALADMGCFAPAFGEANDGMGVDAVTLGIVAESLGRHLVVEPFAGTVLLAGRIVESMGTESQQRALLPGVVAGNMLLAFAHDEGPHAFAKRTLATRARRSAGGWTLDGRKTAVLGAPSADWLVVSARDEASDATSLFLVKRDAPGVTLTAWPTTHEQRAADIAFEGVRVSAADRLGGDAANGDADAVAVIDEAIDFATAMQCADAVGAMDAVVAMTAEYLKTRTQFGQPLSRFQALQHRMADMAVCVHESRAITLLALLRARAAPRERALAVSSAKAKVSACAQFVGRNAVQLHGAVGATQDLVVGNYFRRLTAFESSFGAAGEHLSRYGAIMGDSRFSDRALLGSH
ncbi:acyl-CoA dehydrogenase family protein [Ramlibacter sp.]|uniref:acyl-CoA dehydrogenase family protein n=1 Tax=Ramlibacter sp. TaxID=1917967 RepID=UPI003D0CCB03